MKPVLAWLLSIAFVVVSPSHTEALDRTAMELAALPPDPAPATITNATHYWVSNERRLDLFADAVRDLGGVYLGVGTDQSYILAGWARSELAVLVDFDEDVIDLHAIYGVFFSEAETAAAFRHLWTEAGGRSAEAALERVVTQAERRTRLLELYRAARPHVHARLEIMLEKLADAGEPWFLDDPAQYAHVRALHRTGRVVALRGDFRHDGVIANVARTLERAGSSVRVLYLSNIEQYFMYDATYKANLLALPIDARSMVLRTLPGRPAGFEYIEQSATGLRAWLRRKRVYSVYGMRGLEKGESLEAGRRHVMADPPGS